MTGRRRRPRRAGDDPWMYWLLMVLGLVAVVAVVVGLHLTGNAQY